MLRFIRSRRHGSTSGKVTPNIFTTFQIYRCRSGIRTLIANTTNTFTAEHVLKVQQLHMRMKNSFF